MKIAFFGLIALGFAFSFVLPAQAQVRCTYIGDRAYCNGSVNSSSYNCQRIGNQVICR